jgi:hypothetical protein
MWTDVNGVTAVTADGQQVQVMAGGLQGAMTEIVGDPSFNDSGYWTDGSIGGGTAVVSGGQAVLTANAGTAILTRASLLTVGRMYEVVVTFTGSNVFLQNLGRAVITSGQVMHLEARQTTLELRCTSASTATVTDISVKEFAKTGLVQTTAANRPLYKTDGALHWLQFDGTDSLSSSSNLTLSTIDAVTMCASVRKTSDAAAGQIITHGTSAVQGASYLRAPDAASASYAFVSRGSALSQATYTNAAVAAPVTNVVTGLGDISADTCVLRVNAVEQATSATDQGTGNRAATNIRLGVDGAGTGSFFNGNIYFALIRGALTSGTDLSSLETYAGAKAGLSV